MYENQKQLIATALTELAVRTSQKKIAIRAGVSNATISQMINGNWKNIASEMWRKVQVSLRIQTGWKTAPTTNYRLIMDLLEKAQQLHMSVALSHDAGHGKTYAYTDYLKENENVVYVECKNYWTKKTYIRNLLQACGIVAHGSTEEMIEAFISHLMGLENPILIIDQIDKLKDPQMDLFMDLYNDLFNHCAFVLSGVPALKKRIERGVQRDKSGYRELFSRIGRKFIPLDPTTFQDVQAVCIANGLYDEAMHYQISNTCEGDLRRVKREVEKYYLNKAAKP